MVVYDAEELDAPNRFVAWVSIDFYRFGWVKDAGIMRVETTFDVKEAKTFDSIQAGRLKHGCDVNGVGCWLFSKAECRSKEES